MIQRLAWPLKTYVLRHPILLYVIQVYPVASSIDFVCFVSNFAVVPTLVSPPLTTFVVGPWEIFNFTCSFQSVQDLEVKVWHKGKEEADSWGSDDRLPQVTSAYREEGVTSRFAGEYKCVAWTPDVAVSKTFEVTVKGEA